MAPLSHLPLAFTTNPRSYFATLPGKDSVRVRGMDLVYDPNVQSSAVIITANPAYWKGTRIAALAAAYQSYRPISMKFHWIPVVPVTQQGVIYYGTLWNLQVSPGQLPQTLVTSNGGGLAQVYMPTCTTVALGTNLTQNLYNMAGDLDPDSNPFNFVATVGLTTDTLPVSGMGGYWYVEYEFDLKNACGSAVTYEVRTGKLSDPQDLKSYLHSNFISALRGFATYGIEMVKQTASSIFYNILNQGSRVLFGSSESNEEITGIYYSNSLRDQTLEGTLTLYEPATSA